MDADDDVDDETPSEKESQRQLTSGGHDSPVRAGPARAKDAGPASGRPRPLTRPRKPFACPLGQRVIASGETHVCQPSEGKRKKKGFECSRLRFRRKEK